MSLRVPALYLLVVAVWGTTWIAIKTSVESIPPLTASGLRFAIAFPLLALVTLAYFGAAYVLMNIGGAARPSPSASRSPRWRP